MTDNLEEIEETKQTEHKEECKCIKNLIGDNPVTLKKFDPSKVSLDSFVLVIGKRRYGKSVWAEWLLYHLWPYFYSGGYVFTKTKHNYFWQAHFPENRIYEGFDANIVTQIIEEQKRKFRAWCDGEQNPDDIPFIVMLFDDVISEKTLRYEELLNELCFNGRHFLIFTIACSQDCKGLPPAIRQNADLIAVTYQTQERSICSVEKDFADIFTNSDLFRKVLKENTQDHKLLIIDQSEAKYDVKDIFFVDQAPDPHKNPLPPYRIGSIDFWKEAGNDWEEQLEKCKVAKTLKRGQKDWKKVAIHKLKEDEEKEEWYQWEREARLITNQIELAPEKQREEYYKKLRKELGLEQSHLVQARSKAAKIFKYVPGITRAY